MQSVANEKLLLSGLCCLILVLVFDIPGYRHVITFLLLLLRRIFVTFPALQGPPHSLACCGNFTEAQSQEECMGPISPSECVFLSLIANNNNKKQSNLHYCSQCFLTKAYIWKVCYTHWLEWVGEVTMSTDNVPKELWLQLSFVLRWSHQTWCIRETTERRQLALGVSPRKGFSINIIPLLSRSSPALPWNSVKLFVFATWLTFFVSPLPWWSCYLWADRLF